jgi:threonine/homoserine/homoserine lactone efflux protein
MPTLATLGGIFGTAFLVGLSGAMMPGPLLTVTVSEAARRGASAGPLLVLGHMLLESALVAGLALGLAALLTNPVVIGAIALAGGGMMGWMGQDMVRTARHARLPRPGAAERRRLHPVAAGILVSLCNPYWTIWWATIGIAYVIMGLSFGLAGIVAFFAGHILADFAWYTCVSVGVAKGRAFLSDRLYAWIIGLCGAGLVGFGLWFIRKGLLTLRHGAL